MFVVELKFFRSLFEGAQRACTPHKGDLTTKKFDNHCYCMFSEDLQRDLRIV